MAKAVLISIRPKWCELIANSKKTIEVRKTRPKLETPFKCYIYCTKHGRPLVYGSPCPTYVEENLVQTYGYSREKAEEIFGCWNGKVIGDFVCDKILPYFHAETDTDVGLFEYYESPLAHMDDRDCLSDRDLVNYGNGNPLYGWHISALKIYDEPKELRCFGNFECEHCGSEKECFAPESIYKCSLQKANTNPNHKSMWICDCDFIQLTRPPQSWCYVEGNVGE